jgi:acyl carrier protein
MGLDTVELIMAIEEEFGISVPNAIAAELTTPRKVTDYVWEQITHERLTREQIAAQVRRVIVKQTGTEDFSEDSHFVYDLGLD